MECYGNPFISCWQKDRRILVCRQIKTFRSQIWHVINEGTVKIINLHDLWLTWRIALGKTKKAWCFYLCLWHWNILWYLKFTYSYFRNSIIVSLTLVSLDILGARLEVGQVVILSRLRLVRITLETWNLVRRYTPICCSRKFDF